MKKSSVFNIFSLCCIVTSACLSGSLYADNTDITKSGERFSLNGFPYEFTSSKLENGSLKIVNNELVFTSNKGTDFFNDMISGKNHDNAPRVLFEPKGDFIFSAKLSGKFAGDNDGGALIIYNDIMSSGKLTYERSHKNKPSLWSSVTKGATDDVHHRSFDETSMYLKVARKQNMYFFYSSNDGKNWDILRTFVLDKNDGTKVGLMVQSPESQHFTMQFSDIRYQAKTFNDYWQGE